MKKQLLNLNEEKGIGVIGVILLIVIILAILGGAAYFLYLKYNEEKIETVKTNMLKISWKTAEIKEKAKANGVDPEYIGTKLSDMPEDERLATIKENNIISAEEYEKYYALSDEDIEKLGIENVKNEEDSLYILNYDDTSEIIISKGIAYIGRDKVFKLSDLKTEKELIEKEKEQKEETETNTEETENTENQETEENSGEEATAE